MSFTVGQRVVCIDDAFPEGVRQFYIALPKKDLTYVVRAVSVGISPKGEEGEIAIRLVGLVNPRSSKPPHPERAFNAERFRPLREKEDWEHELEEQKDFVGVPLVPEKVFAGA